MNQAKREALELIRSMPEDATTADILAELFFQEQVDRGLRDAAEGRVISHQDLKERVVEWRKSAGR
jgi:predicted transcriptional regulator